MNELHLRILVRFFQIAAPVAPVVGLSKSQYKALTAQVWQICAEHIQKGKKLTRGRDIPLSNSIDYFWQCGPCGQRDPLWLVGWTQMGFQMFCTEHGNVRHIDFEGLSHPSRGDNLILIDAVTGEKMP